MARAQDAAREVGVLEVAEPERRVEAAHRFEDAAADQERVAGEVVRHDAAGAPRVARQLVAAIRVAGGIQRRELRVGCERSEERREEVVARLDVRVELEHERRATTRDAEIHAAPVAEIPLAAHHAQLRMHQRREQ
jgi:hypothetical protein